MLHVGREKRHHIGAKALGDNDCRIVGARLDALDGLVAIVEHNPVKVLVAAQARGHVFAHVDLDGDQVALVAFIGIDHGNLEVAGVAIRVPAAGDVKPRVQARHNDQAHHDNHADHRVRHVLNVALKQVQDVLHLCLTSFGVLAKRSAVLVHHKRVVPVLGNMVRIEMSGLVGSLRLGR